MKAKDTCYLIMWIIGLVLLFTVGPAWTKSLPQKGGVLPLFDLRIPEDLDHKRYLGLTGKGTFQIPQIKAQVVLIEIFSMYCPVCQREAPKINALLKAIEKNKLQDKIKLIGIAANNSAFEVEFFMKSYDVLFPLFADADMAIYNALGGEIRTPYFIAVKTTEKGIPEIFHTHLGGFEDTDQFLQLIIQESGLK
jgi:thiol-disulfide isomerase/thioredoxin